MIELDPRNSSPEKFFERSREFGLNDPQIRKVLAAVVSDRPCPQTRWPEKGVLSRLFTSRIAPLPKLVLEKIQTSPVDGFQKLLFRTADDLFIESVAIPLHKQGRVSVCLSSQVGCVMGCTFCATARMAQRRNLETWEIIDQFIQTREMVQSSGRRVTGAVFMGMGEPFLNYERVLAAADILRYSVSGAISGKSITISTVGFVPEIDRFTRERRPFRLSISLGAATDAKRAKLVPIAARTPVAEVMAAAARHAQATEDRVMIAYVCIADENVSEADALELGKLIGDTPVRLDLIDVTDPTGRYSPPSEQELKQFRDALSVHLRQPVVRRYSGGKDIQAACGTLAGS